MKLLLDTHTFLWAIADPFDLLLISQARVEGMTVATRDRAISAYDVACIW